VRMEQVGDIALMAAVILQEHGAETYRIESTVTAICQSYQISARCSIRPNEILLVTVEKGQQKFTSMKRVGKKPIDLYKIELINTFSRRLKEIPLTYEEAINQLKTIEKAPDFNPPVKVAAACLTGFVYTLFFNGSFGEGLTSVFVCLITYLILEKICRLGFFPFFEFYLSGLVIGSLSHLCHMLMPAINEQAVITGSIMIILPGVALTNGIKDMLYGYFAPGIFKFCKSLLLITAVSVGIGSALWLSQYGVR
jgi:uncharacterized membrane protein YjjP (DUF1212 family)